MARDARVIYSRKSSFNRKRVSVTNAAGLHPDSNLSRSWLHNRFLNDFQFPRFCHLYRFILCTHQYSFTLLIASPRQLVPDLVRTLCPLVFGLRLAPLLVSRDISSLRYPTFARCRPSVRPPVLVTGVYRLTASI